MERHILQHGMLQQRRPSQATEEEEEKDPRDRLNAFLQKAKAKKPRSTGRVMMVVDYNEKHA
jgi:hypothetical protein